MKQKSNKPSQSEWFNVFLRILQFYPGFLSGIYPSSSVYSFQECDVWLWMIC